MISYMNNIILFQYPRYFASNINFTQQKKSWEKGDNYYQPILIDESKQIGGLGFEDAQIRQDGFSAAMLCTSFIHDYNDDMLTILHYEHRIYIYHSTKYMFINFMLFYPVKERRIEKKSFDLKIKLHDNKLKRNTQYNILSRTYLSENIWTNGLFAI